MNDVLARLWVSLAVDVGRYVLVAGPVFFVFWGLLGERLRSRWLRPGPPERAEMTREIKASMRTVVLFALVGVGVYVATKAGVLRVYTDVGRYGWAYLAVTPLVLIVLQDAYFYFTHRAMHHRLLFRAVHLEHHLSRHTTPFTSYAFSPVEALVHAAFVPLVTLVMPAHELALFVFLLFMVIRNVLGHLGIELYPAGFVTSRFFGVHTTTTHHALHHQRPNTNYGLYFTLWDRLLGTTDPTYEERFARATRPTEERQLPAASPGSRAGVR